MKKQKKPIFLVAVLILLVGTVMAFNNNLLTTPQTLQDQIAADKTAASQKKAEARKKAMAKAKEDAAKSQANSPSPMLNDPDAGDDGDFHTNIHAVDAIPDDAPKLLAPKQRAPKQPKLDHHASLNSQGQWYTPESGVK